MTAAAAVREVIAGGLRRCRVEDGAPVPLIHEYDIHHITHMVAAALRDANLLADPALTAERDRARDIAVALEGQVAAVRAEVAHWRREWIPTDSGWVETCADAIDAALDPDPAEARGEPEEESMTQKEAAIEALDRLADQAVHTAGDDRGRGAAIQEP